MTESIKRPFEAFRKGFMRVCEGRALNMCCAAELELLICGHTSSEYNFDQLEAITRYDDGYDEEHRVIR